MKKLTVTIFYIMIPCKYLIISLLRPFLPLHYSVTAKVKSLIINWLKGFFVTLLRNDFVTLRRNDCNGISYSLSESYKLALRHYVTVHTSVITCLSVSYEYFPLKNSLRLLKNNIYRIILR